MWLTSGAFVANPMSLFMASKSGLVRIKTGLLVPAVIKSPPSQGDYLLSRSAVLCFPLPSWNTWDSQCSCQLLHPPVLSNCVYMLGTASACVSDCQPTPDLLSPHFWLYPSRAPRLEPWSAASCDGKDFC